MGFIMDHIFLYYLLTCMYHMFLYSCSCGFQVPSCEKSHNAHFLGVFKDQNMLAGVLESLTLPIFQKFDPGENENSKFQVKNCAVQLNWNFTKRKDESRAKQVCKCFTKSTFHVFVFTRNKSCILYGRAYFPFNSYNNTIR